MNTTDMQPGNHKGTLKHGWCLTGSHGNPVEAEIAKLRKLPPCACDCHKEKK